MEDNISHLIAMVGATLLFMVAFSLAVVFYDGLGARAEEFFKVTTLSGRHEDATAIIVNTDDLKRKISFEEVYLSILNLPRYVSTEGNSSSSKIVVGSNTYTATFDTEKNEKKIKLEGALTGEYVVGDPSTMNDMLKDFCSITSTCSTDPSQNSNTVLTTNKDSIESVSFSISYDEGSIIYTKN